MNKNAFTLVELIVVVTILSILATLGFISYSSYLVGARDTARTSTINSIANGMTSYSARSRLPIPDNSIEVLANGQSIAWQGAAGKTVLQEIAYSKSGLDPKNEVYYSYYLGNNRQDFQLLIYLEDQENGKETYGSIVTNTYAANDLPYSQRIPYVYGKNLGILTNMEQIPIQEIDQIKDDDFLDIVSTTGSYIAYINNGYSLQGTGAVLQDLEHILWSGGILNSCKSILLKNAKTKGEDGYYYINLNGPRKVYCDMTDQGGGWTRYVDIKGDYSFEEAKKCWLGDYSSDTIDCFNPNQYNFVVNHYKVAINNKTYYKQFSNEIPSKIYSTQNSTYHCKGGREYMSVMGNAVIPNPELDNISYLRLGLNFCDENGREVGGRTSGSQYMNYSDISSQGPGTAPSETSLPSLGSKERKSSAFASELFVR